MCICVTFVMQKFQKPKTLTHSMNVQNAKSKPTKINRTAAKKFPSFIEILNNTKRKEFHGKTENNK